MPICPRCRERFPGSVRYCPKDAAVLVDELDISRLGTQVGNYRLDRILGRGGMGTVYSGEHVYIRKRVAVKVLHAQFARYEGAVARFLREAQAASAIQHPNIVDVTDFGTTPAGGVYFVMEYLEGNSLEECIERDGHIELHRALNIANQIALALSAAHDKHIVHRDLKPDNIMLIRKPGRRAVVRTMPRRDGTTPQMVSEREPDYDFVKILDFGIAKVLTTEDTESDSLQGTIFGTPEYMSPEAARGEDVDLRSDIYSMGVILFDMLTGRPPFDAEDAADVLAMHITKPPPSPRAVAPQREITDACEQLIFKAMSKDPADRHQSMDEFRDELQHCYGSVAYRRNLISATGVIPGNTEARPRRLTDEIDEWLHSDTSRMSLDQARMLAFRPRVRSTLVSPWAPPQARSQLRKERSEARRGPPDAADTAADTIEHPMSPDEEERLADALDAALDAVLDDGTDS